MIVAASVFNLFLMLFAIFCLYKAVRAKQQTEAKALETNAERSAFWFRWWIAAIISAFVIEYLAWLS